MTDKVKQYLPNGIKTLYLVKKIPWLDGSLQKANNTQNNRVVVFHIDAIIGSLFICTKAKIKWINSYGFKMLPSGSQRLSVGSNGCKFSIMSFSFTLAEKSIVNS